MSQEELVEQLEDRLVRRLRVEMAAVSLGDDRLLGEDDAAMLLGVHPKTLAAMRLAGEVAAGYIGRSPRYSLGVIRRLYRDLSTRKRP